MKAGDSPGKLFAGSYIVDYICLYNPIGIGGLYVSSFKGMTYHGFLKAECLSMFGMPGMETA